jgi:hypothetical protein
VASARSPQGGIFALGTASHAYLGFAHIMRKLQLETRAELVMFALANGVIGPNAADTATRTRPG